VSVPPLARVRNVSVLARARGRTYVFVCARPDVCRCTRVDVSSRDAHVSTRVDDRVTRG
jgi:hypothetical protein